MIMFPSVNAKTSIDLKIRGLFSREHKGKKSTSKSEVYVHVEKSEETLPNDNRKRMHVITHTSNRTT